MTAKAHQGELLPPPEKEESLPAIVTTVPGFVTCAEICTALRAKYHGQVYDVSTTAGMAVAVAARRELREARLALDKEKPKVKEEARKFLDSVEKEYKTIHAAIVEYEDVPDAAIKAEEKRKADAKAEADRLETERREIILERVNRLTAIPATAVPLSAADTLILLNKVEAVPTDPEGFQEFLSKAISEKAKVLVQLREMYAAKLAQEEESARIEADRIQMEAERVEREAVEAAERKRVQEEHEAEAARLKAEREKFEAEQAEARRIQAEIDAARQAEKAEEDAKLAAERAELKRMQDEMAEKLRVQEEKAAREKAEAEAAEREKQERAAMELRAKEAAEAKAARIAEEERLAALNEVKRNHKKCRCPWCQGEK